MYASARKAMDKVAMWEDNLLASEDLAIELKHAHTL